MIFLTGLILILSGYILSRTYGTRDLDTFNAADNVATAFAWIGLLCLGGSMLAFIARVLP